MFPHTYFTAYYFAPTYFPGEEIGGEAGSDPTPDRIARPSRINRISR